MTIQTQVIHDVASITFKGQSLTLVGSQLTFASGNYVFDLTTQGRPLSLVLAGDFDEGIVTVSIDDFATGDFVEVASFTAAGRYVVPYLRAGAIVRVESDVPGITVKWEVDRENIEADVDTDTLAADLYQLLRGSSAKKQYSDRWRYHSTSSQH